SPVQMPPLWDQTGVPGLMAFAPLPLLDDVGVGLPDDSADAAECLAAPVVELVDPLVDSLGGIGLAVRHLSLRYRRPRRRRAPAERRVIERTGRSRRPGPSSARKLPF